MARLVLVSIPLILQIISVEAINHKLNLPYRLPVKGHHQSFRRGTSIQYDRMCNATGYGHFACAKCSDPIVNDDTQTSAAQWAAADGDNAWANVKGWWTVLRNGGDDSIGAIQGFVECISWYWQGPTQWDCGDIGDTFCDSVVTCQEANIPAAGLTMTAWANIHMFYNNLYTGVNDAGGAMLAQISGFSKTFAPQGTDELELLKIFLDIFAISYGLIGAGVWNKILKDSPLFKNRGNDHGWAKDSANAGVASSVNLAKDAQPGVQGQLDTQNDLSSALGTLVSGWANVTASYLSELFSGSDAGMAQLDAYILGGNWSDPQFTNSLFALQGIMENVLYGGLIPKAWADHTAVHPVIVFQSGTVTNPLTVILKEDAEDYDSGISDSDALSARTLYGGYSLWLLDAHDCTAREPNTRGMTGSCDSAFVQLLPGTSELTPNNPWGGVLIDDINISAFVGYQLNKMSNGYVMPDNSMYTPDGTQDAEYPFQGGIRTPGFFSSIPVCDIQTVFQVTVVNRGNENSGSQCPTYPCCWSGGKGSYFCHRSQQPPETPYDEIMAQERSLEHPAFHEALRALRVRETSVLLC